MFAHLIGLEIYVGDLCVGTVDTDPAKYAFTPKKLKIYGKLLQTLVVYILASIALASTKHDIAQN